MFDLEIQFALARNVYLSGMVFEGGSPTLAISGESFQFYQLDVVDDFFPEQEVSYVDWAACPSDTQ